MNKSYALLMVAVTVVCGCDAVVLTLPDSETLVNRLNEKGFADFVTKTSLVQDIANRETLPIYVLICIEDALRRYGEKYVINRLDSAGTTKMKQIMEIILQDSPEGIAECNDVFKKYVE